MEVELSVREELQRLIELQQIDTRIQELGSQLEEVPDRLEQFESDLEQNKSILQKAHDIVEKHQKNQRQAEGAVGALRDQLIKYKIQLMEVKTNKEYQAILKEISSTEESISATEDQILELMLNAEDGVREAEVFEKEFREKDREVRRNMDEVQEFSGEAEKTLEGLREDRLKLASTVAAEVLTHYERISSARGGLGLARIVEGSCQGCNVRLRPQLVAEIRAASRIASCEKCQRFLYFQTLKS